MRLDILNLTSCRLRLTLPDADDEDGSKHPNANPGHYRTGWSVPPYGDADGNGDDSSGNSSDELNSSYPGSSSHNRESGGSPASSIDSEKYCDRVESEELFDAHSPGSQTAKGTGIGNRIRRRGSSKAKMISIYLPWSSSLSTSSPAAARTGNWREEDGTTRNTKQPVESGVTRDVYHYKYIRNVDEEEKKLITDSSDYQSGMQDTAPASTSSWRARTKEKMRKSYKRSRFVNMDVKVEIPSILPMSTPLSVVSPGPKPTLLDLSTESSVEARFFQLWIPESPHSRNSSTWEVLRMPETIENSIERREKDEHGRIIAGKYRNVRGRDGTFEKETPADSSERRRRRKSDTETRPCYSSARDIAIDRPQFRVYRKTTSSTSQTILFLPLSVDKSSYLSLLPDSTFLGDLIIPGTHESLALHGWPFSQCQEAICTLDVQLREGIRFFDIRLSVRDGILRAYHGPYPQLTLFTDMLSQLLLFFEYHPLETVIFCIQQEAPSSPSFSRLTHQAMKASIDSGTWFLENRVPTLGEVRGKAILLSRFGRGLEDGGSEPWEVVLQDERGQRREPRMGWRPEWWPDCRIEGFSWHCGETEARTQDWYDVQTLLNIPAKMNVLADHLIDSSHLPPGSNLTISFASGSSIPFALPPWVAKGWGWPSWGLGTDGVNKRLEDWLLDRLEEQVLQKQLLGNMRKGDDEEHGFMLRGVIPVDYYRSTGVVDVMIAFNGL